MKTKIAEIVRSLKKYQVRPIKRLGQHFLIDEKILRLEVKEAAIKSSEIILEIGPGPGFLTEQLAKRAKKVIAIEKDRKMIELLKKKLRAKNVNIIQGDALKISWPAFDKLVANIPYQISSGVIEKLAKAGKPAILILQKEFAQRLVAEPSERDYGRITVLARFHFTPVLLKSISKAAFWPAPEVNSALVKLYPHKHKPKTKNEQLFFRLVRGLFSHPNQKVAKAFVHARREFKLSKEEAKEIAKELPHSEKRVYHLGLEQLAELSNRLTDKLKNLRG